MHPDMVGSDPILNDVGIIVLDEPVDDVHPARIAETDFLSRIDPTVLARRRVLTLEWAGTGMLGNPGAGDSGGPDFLDGRIVAITSTGFEYVLSQRIDLPEVQEFIRSFLPPEGPTP